MNCSAGSTCSQKFLESMWSTVSDTPRVEASVLNARMQADEDLVILDSRPLG